MRNPKLIDSNEYFRTPSGVIVNISLILRINDAVVAAIKPGMSEADIDHLIIAVVRRLSPN